MLTYDPLGRLYKVGAGTGATFFLYSGDQLVAEYNPGTGPGQGGLAVAETSTTTVRTVINGGPSTGSGQAEEEGAAAATLEQFEGVALDAEAQAAIAAALEACAVRARAADEALGEAAADYAESNPDAPFVALPPDCSEWRGALEPPVALEEWQPFADGEGPWEMTGADLPDWATPEALERVAAVARKNRKGGKS